MKVETDLRAIKALAHAMLELDIEQTRLSPLVVKHPFTDNGISGVRKPDGSIAIADLLNKPDDLALWRKQVGSVIDEADSAFQIYMMVTKSYALGFLKFARKQGHCSGNALQNLVTDEQRSRRMFSKIRSALARKNLTLDEFLVVFRAVTSRIREGKSEYLGVLIRLLTGLESNIVCALQWGDFDLVEDYAIYRLAVTRQVANDGVTLRGFDSMEDYRLLVCCEILAQFLLEQKAKTEAELAPFYGGSLLDFPIVAGSHEKTQYLDFRQMLSPIMLEKLSKEILAEANMDDHVIEIPDSLNGTKETNLSHYNGDFFRENFKYWGQELCQFSQDELANYVGNKPVTTFGRYYCDFLNDAALLVSFVKLQRLDAILSHGEEIRCCRKSGAGLYTFEHECSLDSRLPMHLHLCLTIPEGSGDIRITVKNRFGLSTSLSGFSEE